MQFRADYGWGAVSKEAKDLIEKMLTKDPAQRITAVQVLEDPWLVDKHAYSSNDLKASGAASQLGTYLSGSLEEHE